MNVKNFDEAISRLSPKMRAILDAELAAGNEIKEIWAGRFTGQAEDHTFIFLKKEFINDIIEDTEDIKYNLVDDRHYWKAEYYDSLNCQVIACDFNF